MRLRLWLLILLLTLGLGVGGPLAQIRFTAPGISTVDLSSGVTGVLPLAKGGTGGSTVMTQGSILFAGASGVTSQDNAHFFWDDTNNRLGIGTTAPTFALDFNGLGQGVDGAFTAYSDDTSATTFRLRKSRGTLASPTIVNDGDPLGTIFFSARGGTSFRNNVSISAIVNGAPSGNTVPSDLQFNTGTTSALERMRITSAGLVGIGITAPTQPLHISTDSDSFNTLLQTELHSTSSASPALLMRKSRGTQASPLIVATDDQVMTLQGVAYHGSAYIAIGDIRFLVDGTVTSGQRPGSRLSLRTTTPNGSLTERWQVAAAGHLLAGADNTYDIGASGATRPRTGYFGTSVITPLVTTTNLTPISSTITLTSGQFLVHDGSAGAPPLATTSNPFEGFYYGNGNFQFSSGSAGQYAFGGDKLNMRATVTLGWTNGSDPTGTRDLALVRDASDTLALRRTTNAQTFRAYGTWTDASNYVGAQLASSSTLVTLAAITAGSGADNVSINLDPAGTGVVQIDGVDGVSGVCLAVTVTKGIVTGCTP